MIGYLKTLANHTIHATSNTQEDHDTHAKIYQHPHVYNRNNQHDQDRAEQTWYRNIKTPPK